ncbi:MAG: hypothetical protein CL834_04075 [Crocinitomicaceae bacterium]|nr:hypothetical protein [Crocinitomicaceae bacterium]
MTLQENIDCLEPIGLNEIGEADLMSRLDQKYLILKDWIPELLSRCNKDYQILEVDGIRLATYSNHFIDTPQLESFNQHIRGKKSRFKARVRSYGSNGLSFLEVKRKTVHGRTMKARIARSKESAWNAPLTDAETRFLSEHYGYSEGRMLEMQSTFNRLTLVSTALNERITIDTDLTFFQKNQTEGLGSIAVMEVKQERINRFSPILLALRDFRFSTPPLGRKTSLSKYIVGTLLLNRNLESRVYRSAMKRIEYLKQEN